MTTIGEVTHIGRYPAKSMLGERLERADLVEAGLVGDRGWATRDEVRGGIRGAKKIAGLMHLAARYLEEPTAHEPTPPIEITLPDGTTVRSDAADVNERLSAALDHAVTLWPLQPAEDLDHYRRGAPDSEDFIEELRDIFGRTEDEPFPDFGVFPPEVIEFESPPGTYLDAWPLMIMTTRSLATLQELNPDSAIDVRRFRPNLLIDVGETDERWPELSWVGRRFGIGTAEIQVLAGCPRCVMVTRPVADLPEDRSVLRTIVREANQDLGVYATVTRPGTVSMGDPLVPLD